MPGVVASSLAYLDAAQPTAAGDDGVADVNRQLNTRRRTIRPDMSDLDQTVLFEQFVAAREQAITLTDHFQTIDVDNPGRGKLWEHVIRQADTARLLLERWLRSGQLTDQTHPGPFDFHRY